MVVYPVQQAVHSLNVIAADARSRLQPNPVASWCGVLNDGARDILARPHSRGHRRRHIPVAVSEK